MAQVSISLWHSQESFTIKLGLRPITRIQTQHDFVVIFKRFSFINFMSWKASRNSCGMLHGRRLDRKAIQLTPVSKEHGCVNGIKPRVTYVWRAHTLSMFAFFKSSHVHIILWSKFLFCGIKSFDFSLALLGWPKLFYGFLNLLRLCSSKMNHYLFNLSLLNYL